MPTYEKLNGVVSLASNTPGAPTGYGTQARYLVDRLVRHGIKTAVLSNYGHEGSITTLSTPFGKIPHYPKGYAPHSVDVMSLWHEHHRTQYPKLRDAIVTLYDVWVYNQLKHDGDIFSWVPIDHETLPPMVGEFVSREQVHPIAMAPHGQRVLAKQDIESTYIPHAVDTRIFKPATNYEGSPMRSQLGVGNDKFLVTMVANNKSNGYVHRKAFGENLMAFSIFQQRHPEARLYLHTDHRPVINGFDIGDLLRSVGLSQDKVIFADPNELMVGYEQKALAAVYSVSDILLAVSYGEGFNVPLIEAQACGTPVITSNWTAPKDLAGPSSFLVEGQLWWNNMQKAYWQIPSISSIVGALEQAFERWSGPSTDEASVEFAKQFDVETVWSNYWLPFFRSRFDA